jgi:hypothetical protein
MQMAGDLSKKNWLMLAITVPFIAGMTYLAWQNVKSRPAFATDTRDVSFKIVFDDRVGFPQTIRQSTIEKLLGPEYEIVARPRSGEAGDSRDCRIQRHGGLLTVRVPQSASSAEIAARLEQLSRVKLVTVSQN